MKSMVLALLTLCATGLNAEVLATAGDAQIHRADFERKYSEVLKEVPQPPTKEKFLHDLIHYELGVQEAKKLGLEADPLVKERLNQVLYNALLEKQLSQPMAKIKITEKELKAHYKNNPQLRISHILLDPKMRKGRLDEILTDVKSSKKPFPELVQQYSEDIVTKDLGGDAGFQSRASSVPKLYQAALTMKVGEIKGPIETRFGLHIIRLDERRAFADADKKLIHDELMAARRVKVFDDYFARIKKQYKININAKEMKALTE